MVSRGDSGSLAMLAAMRREMEEMITELRTLDSFSKLTRGEKELLN